MSKPTSSTLTGQAIQLAADIIKACGPAGIADPAEIPALIAFARSAEDFHAALKKYQHAQHAYNRFIATHGAEDPGQDEYVRVLTGAREIYNLAHRNHQVALKAWHVARGLEAPEALAA